MTDTELLQLADHVVGPSEEEKQRNRERDEKLVRIAERLGVPEGSGDGMVVFVTQDGRSYSWLALMEAWLDRMEA